MKKILVVFKTHLDIGFTDFADTVVERYMKEYIPNAIHVARQMREEKERFIWTTGSWLIDKYLEEGEEKELLEDAIRNGEIRWHGLPFTTHTELMNQELFTYGLCISQKLDERFKMETIAAKMTDVPGHTKAIIPHLYRTGIRFLHIGVNPASRRPSVPDMFRWKADSGEEIVMMYNGDYGKMTEIGTSGVAVYFAHTGDNRGPQSVEQIKAIYQNLHKQYPEAEIVAGTLEDIAEVALGEKLSVVTEEIGDTWIYGVASDSKKVNQYRALLRLKDKVDVREMEKMYRELIMIPEHTWGLDEKMYLGYQLENGELVGEHEYFQKEQFEQVRKTEKFQRMENSWKEQRRYVNKAVAKLSGVGRMMAEAALREYKRELIDVYSYEQKKIGEQFEIGGYQTIVNAQGELVFLSRENDVIADDKHPLGSFLYEVFSEEEYERFKKQYVITDEIWAQEDFGKYGIEKAVTHHENFRPKQVEIWAKENVLVIKAKLSEKAVTCYGGMEQIEWKITFYPEKIELDFAWFGKHCSRIPEGVWLGFCLKDSIEAIEKMGTAIRPDEVVENGNRRMHAIDRKIMMSKMELETIDAPVISIGEPGLLNFTNEQPDLEKGVYVNLFNNVWGTNFTMWYEDDARFRFALKWKNK